MDIRVTVGGVEAVVTVQDAAEAATLLATLANMQSSWRPANKISP